MLNQQKLTNGLMTKFPNLTEVSIVKVRNIHLNKTHEHIHIHTGKYMYIFIFNYKTEQYVSGRGRNESSEKEYHL